MIVIISHLLIRKLLLVFLFLILTAELLFGNDNSKKQYLNSADSLTKIAKYDDALFNYFLAYDQGLPRDSLFYFWAELYLNKGNLDSALAVNRSALDMGSPNLRKELLRQRYSIYVLLGADEQAMSIAEELNEKKTDHHFRISPFLNSNLLLKIENEKIKTPEPSFYTIDSTGDYYTDEGLASLRLSGKLRFSALQNKFPDFSFGSIFQVKKNSSITALSAAKPFDSLIIESGGSFSIENIAGKSQIELRSTYNSDLNDVKRWNHGLIFSFMAEKTGIFSIGGYTMTLQNGTEYDYQYGFLSFILDINRNSALSLSPALTFSCFASKHESISLGLPLSPQMLYFNVDALESDKIPLFYKDAQMRIPLDTSGLNGADNFISVLKYAPQIKNNSTPVMTILDLPLSYFHIEPSVCAAVKLKRNWVFKPGMKLSFDIYTELYKWYDFKIEELTYYMAVNYSDGSFYQIKGMNDNGSGDASIEVGDRVGTFYKKRRIDTALQWSVSFEHVFKRVGNMVFTLSVNKLWNNLPSSCPVEKSNWSVSFNTDWNYSLAFSDFRKKND